jgi:thioredoxin reductase
MTAQKKYDVIIIGGSYAGLSAGMALGRALMHVLIIDDGKPCNQQTPHSHNFLTNDGKTPAEITAIANLQVMRYQTVQFCKSSANQCKKNEIDFQVQVKSGEIFTAQKLIFATGIRDLLPAIEGLTACWGISVIHCPYCHLYEVRNETTGILGNGDHGYEFAKFLSQWSKDLTLYTNGIADLSEAQHQQLQVHNINVVAKEIDRLAHENGYLQEIVFSDGSKASVKVLYAPCPFEQHCKIPELMGCRLTEEGYIQIDNLHETTVEGIYAIGDNASKFRTIANAVSMGAAVGITISKKLILEAF